VIVPAYEAATQRMLDQISTTLTTKLPSQESQMELLLTQMTTLTRQVQSLSKELSTVRAALGNQNAPTNNLQNEIVLLLSQSNYEAAFTKALEASSAEMALFCCQKADLSSLLDSREVVLSQPILLCLGQQLGSTLPLLNKADVWTATTWLQDILLNLNPDDAGIGRHVGEIMRTVAQNVQNKLETMSGDGGDDKKLKRKLQMLLQVVRGVGSTS